MATWSCALIALPWCCCLVCFSVLGCVLGLVSPGVSGVLFVFPSVFLASVTVQGVWVSVLVSPYLSGIVVACGGVCVVVLSSPSGCDVVWVCPALHSGVGVACL